MNIVELIDYVEASIDHDDLADDEAWFSRTMREEILKVLKKVAEIGSCKECKSADFCYDNPDVCFCLQHDHTMYADDTCNYFYRDRSSND